MWSLPFTKLVHPYPVDEVASRATDREVDPREADVTKDDVDAIWASMKRLYESRLHPAVALCVRRRGKVILDGTIGHARGNAPTDPPNSPRLMRATPDTLFNLYSAAKSVTAMVVHLLDERGLVHLDDPVAEYLPEFGRNGKEWITLRHVLTHRAGLPALPPALMDMRLLTEEGRFFELLCEQRPLRPFGRHLGYHAVTGGVIIGEVVRRVTGRDIRAFFRDEIARPLGFRHLSYGVSPSEVEKVAENALTGPPALPPYSWMLRRSLGADLKTAVDVSNSPEFLTAIVPSVNMICTANEGSRFFQLLLNEGELDGVRVFEQRTVRRAVAEQSFLEVDSIMGLPVRYGMGFMLGGRYYSLYGHDTPRAFGHLGFTAIVAWADPDRDLAACLMTTGKPFITLGQLKWIEVARTIARHCRKVL